MSELGFAIYCHSCWHAGVLCLFRPLQIPIHMYTHSQDLARFCRDGRSAWQAPPPLNQAEEAEERGATAKPTPGSASAAAAGSHVDDSSSMKTTAEQPASAAWSPSTPVTPANFLSYVQTLPFYRGQLRHTQTLPGRQAKTVPLEESLEKCGVHPAVIGALRAEKGVGALYLHQARAIEAVLGAGGDGGDGGERDVIVTTATASGKSLCYTVPWLHSYLTAGPEDSKVSQSVGRSVLSTCTYTDGILSTALYQRLPLPSFQNTPYIHPYHTTTKIKQALFIFPTKALAQDQLASLRALAATTTTVCTRTSTPGIHTYDGDTPKPQRDAVRDASSLLLTNPDMLHASVLPGLRGSPGWRAWLRGLRCVDRWMNE